MLYSPFDCLGLKPSLSISKQDLSAARKRAYLHVHPDKRAPFNISATRWPTLDHLTAAVDYLSENCEKAYKVFAGFPHTFHPEHQTGSSKVYDVGQVSDNFMICGHCEMVLDAKNLEKHMLQDHHEKWCHYCSDFQPIGHIHCRSCSDSSHISTFRSHLSDCHCWQPCSRCPSELESLDELWHHLLRKHSWSTCKFCNKEIAEGFFWFHIIECHHLRPCKSCPTTSSDLEHQISHLELEHHMQSSECQVCGLSIPITDIGYHLIRSHHHKQCPFCEKVEAEEDYHDHISNEHNLQPCPVCSAMLPEQSLTGHLTSDHQYRLCPFCSALLATEMEVRQHLNESHNETEVCVVCQATCTSDGLKVHLREDHRWQPCQVCGELHDEVDLQLHMRLHTRSQCVVCKEFILDTQFDSHIYQHSRHECPVCQILTDDLRNHLSRHRDHLDDNGRLYEPLPISPTVQPETGGSIGGQDPPQIPGPTSDTVRCSRCDLLIERGLIRAHHQNVHR